VLSNHDVVRHASRYGLPQGSREHPQDGKEWLLTDGKSPVLNRELGHRRAKAATLLMLALPGSAYLYQGEELGLHEVADLPREALQDPAFLRSKGAEKGRDGCRVPLPWTSTGASFGFGDDGSHLPQPGWFAAHAADVQEGVPSSMLSFYRAALRLRRQLATSESFEWVDDPGDAVLHFARRQHWHCVVNLGPEPVALPAGNVVLASDVVDRGRLPSQAAAWVT
jgi:alpha-glucosidase